MEALAFYWCREIEDYRAKCPLGWGAYCRMAQGCTLKGSGPPLPVLEG